MNTYIKSISLVVLILGVFSCSKELTPENPYTDQVSINAGISLEILSRVSEDGATFTNHDVIKVQNMNRSDKNIASFKYYASTGRWTTDEELFWAGSTDNVFHAWYPASASYDRFTMPNDQSADIYVADWMTASKSAKQSEGSVNLTFTHNLAKLTVNITEWGNEFADGQKNITNAQVLSLSSVVTNNGTTVYGDKQTSWIKGHIVDNDSFEVIIVPGTYTSDTEILKIFVNGNSAPLVVKTTNEIAIKSGKAYTFNVTVGKDNILVDASSVKVNEWGDEILDDLTTSLISQKELGKAIIEDQHIVYNHTTNSSIDRDLIILGDSFYLLKPCLLSRVTSISEIEMKFQMATLQSDEPEAYLFYSERPFTQNGAILDPEGLKLRWNNRGRNVVDNELVITWGQMGVSLTEKIVLKISVPDQTVTVNGKVISAPGIQNFTSIDNIFSSYYYESDDGFEKSWLAVPTGSKLYYVKIGNAYKGYATQADYTDGTTQWCWESVYNGTVYQEFSMTFFESHGNSEVRYRASRWDHFGGANDNDYIDEYNINHGHGTAVGGTVWAPVNCGYHETDYTYGKLYQWGRKYGQGYDESYTRIYDATYPTTENGNLVTGSVAINVGESEAKKDVFYYMSNSSSWDDWWTEDVEYSQYANLWNSGTASKPVKSIYDPCPSGWRVPTKAEIEKLIKNRSEWTTVNGQNGYWFSGDKAYSESRARVFFPAGGQRAKSGGYGYNRRYIGCYWTSGYCYDLSMNDYRVSCSDSYASMSGNSVRCVME